MKIKIKPAAEEDISLLIDMMKEFYHSEHLPFHKEILKKCITELLFNEQYGILRLVLQDAEILGYFVLTFGYSLEFHGRDALLDEFYIREKFRNKGAGTQCLHYIQEYCIKENIKAVHLEVDRDNLSAKELYHRNGYNDHNRYSLTKWLIL